MYIIFGLALSWAAYLAVWPIYEPVRRSKAKWPVILICIAAGAMFLAIALSSDFETSGRAIRVAAPGLFLLSAGFALASPFTYRWSRRPRGDQPNRL